MSECILWSGPLDKDGYGNAGGGRKAHVEAFVAAGGVIPEGREIDHLCHVRACVNAGHMEAVTHAENMARTIAALATHCARGHEYTEANTVIRTNGNGRRCCRTCWAAASKEWAVRNKDRRNARRRELYAARKVNA